MKKMILGIILIVPTTTILLFSSFNEGKVSELNSNYEVHLEGDAERGEYLSTIIGCDHCHSPKQMTPQGPVPIKELWMSGYQEDRTLPEISKEKLGLGKWELHIDDLTAFVGPWGVSFGANITPDETGIGNWTFKHFKTAMTKGKYKGLENSRPILPPMPWPSYMNMEEQDLRDIFAYLKSLPPIRNNVPAFIPIEKI